MGDGDGDGDGDWDKGMKTMIHVNTGFEKFGIYSI